MKVILVFLCFITIFLTYYLGQRSYHLMRCADRSVPDVLLVDSLSSYSRRGTGRWLVAHGATLETKERNFLTVSKGQRYFLAGEPGGEEELLGTLQPVWNAGTGCGLRVRAVDSTEAHNPAAGNFRRQVYITVGVFLLAAGLAGWLIWRGVRPER